VAAHLVFPQEEVLLGRMFEITTSMTEPEVLRVDNFFMSKSISRSSEPSSTAKRTRKFAVLVFVTPNQTASRSRLLRYDTTNQL
jgi:hypothetical protein